MPRTVEAIEASIREATQPGYRQSLETRGQARAMVWRDGIMPEDAPIFSELLSYDLLSYAYSLASSGLRLLELGRASDLSSKAFEHAAGAMESIVANGTNDESAGFNRLVCAASYHLGGYAARAYSMLRREMDRKNLTPCERSLALLVLRDISALYAMAATWRLAGKGSDATVVSEFENSQESDVSGPSEGSESDDNDAVDSGMDLAVTDNFMAAVLTALLAFERGDHEILTGALTMFRTGLDCCAELRFVPQWWCHRLAIHLFNDLWTSSLHERIPITPMSGDAADWVSLRELFITSQFCRSRSEIELWPSQLDAAERAMKPADNMVVALPTGAGKTRIAELCILTCLATRKRVVLVTPLRALSAQTEANLARTFQPLGKTVSSLYGSIGVSEADTNILSGRDIVVATPEKLDFVLRSSPELLDDVGLVVLDEGHMIGLGEREVRYEVQIQRLLRRKDAASRRIVCLSAILPEGEQLNDFVAWVTQDKPEGLVKNEWRPTRLRFGEVEWRSGYARLNVTIGTEKPFVPRFLQAKPSTSGRRKKLFPSSQRELCVAVAWRLVEEGHSVLIFCPMRKSVEPFATAIVDLCKRGFIASVMTAEEEVLESALAIGSEWFGVGHPILQCLKLGVAIHHGALPTPFRREVERLLRRGVLKVTVSSPTLAQGLNLSATTLLFHGLSRGRDPLDSSEFRNVVGRAGRAYVDVQGLVLYPMFDNIGSRRAGWLDQIANQAGREMESGLLRLVYTLLKRMHAKVGGDISKLLEYVVNADAWTYPELKQEVAGEVPLDEEMWDQYVASLDTAILCLLGDLDVPDDEVEAKLDEVLHSSLWQRRIAHQKLGMQKILRAGLVARANYVWRTTDAPARRGYFLAGVGLKVGSILDANAQSLKKFLILANAAILENDESAAIKQITSFAEEIFKIAPFRPETIPEHWREILSVWLKGDPISSLDLRDQADALQFIESALIYKLPWGMEALRVRDLAHQASSFETGSLSDYELGLAPAAVETGSLNQAATLLMRCGFGSRSASIKVARELKADFENAAELRGWLKLPLVEKLSADANWPTAQTHSLWVEFRRSFEPAGRTQWACRIGKGAVVWDSAAVPPKGSPLRIFDTSEGESLVLSADGERIGRLRKSLSKSRQGLLRATAGSEADQVEFEYVGPNDLH